MHPASVPKGDIGLVRQGAVGRVRQLGPDQDGHDRLDPALLRTARGRHRFFGRLAALHVNEQARRLQMCVAGEIEVVDLRAFEDGCLLRSDVRREKQEPVVGVIGRQVRSAPIQLLDDDSDILMTEMPLLLDQVTKGSVRSLPGDDAVEAGQGFPWRTELGLRHPLLESGPVQVEVGSESPAASCSE